MKKWENRIVGDANVAPAELKPNPSNWRRHPEKQRKALEGLLGEVGWVGRVLVNLTTGYIIDGHARYEQALDRGEKSIPVTYVALTPAEEKIVLATFDSIGAMAETDDEALRSLLGDFTAEDPDLSAMLDGLEKQVDGTQKNLGALAEKFGVPPFSVLDTRQGYWQERKRIWKQKIGDQGESREGALGDSVVMSINSGVSILDPVLAEIIVAWFGTRGGTVIDPFAGDTVFGFVAATRGMKFRGIELRQEQAELNQKRVDAEGLDAVYHNDDSRNIDAYIADGSADLVFSCPPYADLEVYSDDPRDLSTLDTDAFLLAYRDILKSTYAKLKDNRFAVIVISEVRATTGAYIGLVPYTIDLMRAAVFAYYNELILVGAAGTLPIRAPQAMLLSRKAGRQHQNVLVFAKGDPEEAARILADRAVAEYEAAKRTTADHETILVFAKGDPNAAAAELGPIDAELPTVDEP